MGIKNNSSDFERVDAVTGEHILYPEEAAIAIHDTESFTLSRLYTTFVGNARFVDEEICLPSDTYA